MISSFKISVKFSNVCSCKLNDISKQKEAITVLCLYDLDANDRCRKYKQYNVHIDLSTFLVVLIYF